MRSNAQNFLIFFVSTILIFTAVSLNSWEVNFSGISLSPETLLHLVLLFFIFIAFLVFKNFYLLKITFINFLVFIALIYLFTLICFDIYFYSNFNAFYELNFLVLLSFIPICFYAVKLSPNFFNYFIYFLIILLITQSIFFQNNFSQALMADEITSYGVVVSRLGIFGYVSNTFAIILSFLITFLANQLLNRFKFMDLILITILVILLLQTFSRTGIISAYLGLGILLIYKRFIYGVIFLAFPPVLLVFVLSSLAIFQDQGLVIRLLELDITNNPRFRYWINAISNLSFGYEYFFGKTFFRIPTDNTLVGIYAGRGIFGLIAYSIFLTALILSFSNKSKSFPLFIALIICFLFSSLTIDYFGQRKIIYFFAILISCSAYQINSDKLKQNNSSVARFTG